MAKTEREPVNRSTTNADDALQWLEGKRVLVTGGAGFVASNMLSRLLTSKCEIRATLNRRPPQIQDERIQFITADLESQEDCETACENMNYVIHCAAFTAGARVIQDNPMEIANRNSIINTRIMEAAFKAGVSKFLYISSNVVYPNLPRAVKEDEMMSGEPYRKYYPIAWMKRAGEFMARAYTELLPRPMTTIIVRPANLYGPYDHFDIENGHVLPAWIEKALLKFDPFEVWGNCLDTKDFLFIDDFIDGALAALENIQDFNPVNLGGGEVIKLRDALDIILEAANHCSADIVKNASKPSMIPFRALSIAKAERMLGFQPKTKFASGIAKTIAWRNARLEIET